VLVADLAGAESIGPQELDALELAPSVTRVLFRTSNSDLWRDGPRFDSHYVGITRNGAHWLVERGIGLVGMDYLSVQRYADDFETHRVLLSADIVLLEGLILEHVEAGDYELLCLPLSVPGSEAAPARAVLAKA
jgi:arylformamidase